MSTRPSPAPYTIRFIEWRAGHHGQRPADIPVHSVEQALLILRAISHAISQPGHARAVLFNAEVGESIYLTDDYVSVMAGEVDKLPPVERWSFRPTLILCTPEQAAELQSPELAQAVDESLYGPTLPVWDGKTPIEEIYDSYHLTTLTQAEVEALAAPLEWHEEGQRRALFDLPPVLKPADELLAELREAKAEMDAYAAEQAASGAAA